VQRAAFGRPREPAPDFHATGLREGKYALIVRGKGYAPSIAGPFEVGPGRLVAGIDVRMHRGGRVHGTVRDAAGNPVAKALFWITPEADPLAQAHAAAKSLASGERYADYRYERADDAGRFQRDRLPPGVPLRAVAAHADGGVAVSAPFVLRDGGSEDVELRLVR
jgi:hypothetical protein